MVDHLDDPRFAESLILSGFEASDIPIIRDVARHAADQALATVIRITGTLDDESRHTALLSALVVLKGSIDKIIRTHMKEHGL